MRSTRLILLQPKANVGLMLGYDIVAPECHLCWCRMENEIEQAIGAFIHDINSQVVIGDSYASVSRETCSLSLE